MNHPVKPAGELASAISRDDMVNLPVRRYEGDVRLVATPGEFEDAAADFASEGVVGLDTETRPAFRKGESHLPCLVQVATARRVYLFQLSHAAGHPVLRELMENPASVKAGVALAYDLRSLKHVFAFEEKGVVDLGLVARRSGYAQTGLRNLAGIFLGIRIPKGNRTSNWAAPLLSPAQITYAATDAWACRELFLRFETLGITRATLSP
jgi:ribonuclease D